MKKRIISLILAAVIFVSLAGIGVVPVSATTEGLKMSDEGIRILKAEEGFSRTPYWDYAQWTVGYGTKCPDDKLEEYKKNGITESEAEALLREFLVRFETEINDFASRYGMTFSQQQFDAMMLFSYNCGAGWTYDTTDAFHKAVRSGATGNDLIRAITLWCNAGGTIQTFLIRRRLSEANIYLNGVYSQTPPENYCYVLLDTTGGTVKYRIQGYDSNLTDTIQRVPTYTGYTFDGWYTERTGGTKVTVLDASVKNSRLYAHWIDDEGNDPTKPVEPVTVTVTDSDVNLRQGPGLNYKIVGTANKGDTKVITETAYADGYNWGKFDGGWIALKYTNYETAVNQKPTTPEQPETPEEPTVPEQPETPETPEEPTVPEQPEAPEEPTVPEQPAKVMGTVKVDGWLNVRSGAGTGYSIVSTLNNGTRVEILEQKTVGAMVWARISAGWISMTYVTLDATGDSSTGNGGSSNSTPSTPSTSWTGVVSSTLELRVRSGPSTNYSVVGYLNPGTKVTITEEKSSGSMTWGKISNGWISLDYVRKTSDSSSSGGSSNGSNSGGASSQTITGTVKVNNDMLRIRSGPGTSYAIAGYLSNGTKIEILEKKTVGSTVWGRTNRGWVSMDYVVVSGQSSSSAQTSTKTITTDCLRIRSNAGTSYSVVGFLYRGAKVEVLETKSVNGTVWGRISKGWISMDYAK